MILFSKLPNITRSSHLTPGRLFYVVLVSNESALSKTLHCFKNGQVEKPFARKTLHCFKNSKVEKPSAGKSALGENELYTLKTVKTIHCINF